MTVPDWRSADLWSGLASLALGALALWAGADYAQGTAGRLGPGYVPRLLALLLVGIGVLLIARSTWRAESIEPGFGVRPVVLILGSVLVFAFMFSHFGLIPAILAAVGVANSAVSANSWRSALGVGVALAAFAWLLFVKALGLPLPVFLP